VVEWLYQVSLGKATVGPRDEATLDAVALERPDLAMAASLAIALSELRQELAEAEDSEDTMLVTATKRKVELVEDLLLQRLDV